MSDPVLKEAMAEVKAIMKKHDIGGAITLVSKLGAEFRYELEPSWSVVHVEGNTVRFRSRRKDFSSKDAQREAVELSVHLLCQIRDLGEQNARNMNKLIAMLAGYIDFEHTPAFDFEPHTEH